jgi:hypothetical protein
MGTPGYLSPEVVQGGAVTEATDWWGWAATLAFAASGAPPFGRGPMDAVLGRVATGDADLSGVDPRLAPLLYAALSPRPQERPDADEVVEALERYAAGRPPTEVFAPVPTARHTQALPARPAQARPVGPLGLPPEPEPWDDGSEGDEQGEHGQVVSDWQAAAELGPGQPDPRISRPQRTGTLVALLCAMVAGLATWPVVAAAVLVLWCWAARTADRSVTSLVVRRHSRGPRRSDVPLAVAASPWHLVVGAVGTLVGLVVPLLVAVSAVFSAALATVAVTGGPSEPNAAVPLAAGSLLGVLVAWWGPGGSGLRRGSRSLVRGVAPGPRTTRVLVVAALLLAGGLTVWGYTQLGVPQWWPWQAPSGIWSGLGR